MSCGIKHKKVESGQKHLADGHKYGSEMMDGWQDLHSEVSQHDSLPEDHLHVNCVVRV